MELCFWHLKQVQSKEPNFYGEFLITTPPPKSKLLSNMKAHLTLSIWTQVIFSTTMPTTPC
jgi:hypothetical protein